MTAALARAEAYRGTFHRCIGSHSAAQADTARHLTWRNVLQYRDSYSLAQMRSQCTTAEAPAFRATRRDLDIVMTLTIPPRYFSSQPPYYRYQGVKGGCRDAVDDGRRGVFAGGDD